MQDQQLILNRYRPIATAGSGGFGTVQVAWDTRIQRKVAIKCIELDEVDVARAVSPGDAVTIAHAAPSRGNSEARSVVEDVDDDTLIHSLAHVPGLDEARTAAMLSDASIVAVYDFEVQGSTAYLIMEYVEGITLTQLLRHFDDLLTLDMVAAVFAFVSHALEVAHNNQVLHLDIKPDNVLINRQGQVKVTDFGLATLADASGYGETGGGTIGYMPLEQMRQEALDARCDEWALASVTYEMLAGENPFLAPDLTAAEAAIEDAELVLPSLCWDDIDPEVDDIVFRALDPDREERYHNVASFAEELEPLLGDPKRGTRELASLVGHAQIEDDDANVRADERAHVPLCDRITWRQRTIAAHIVGALGSALVAFVALVNVSQVGGFESPLFWGLLALVTLAGALKTHLGALLSYGMLSVALIASEAPVAGIVLLAATALWWYFLGRHGNKLANTALVPSLAGAVGGGQLVPLVSGFCLRPLRAVGSTAFCVLVATILAALGSQTLFGWNPLAYARFGGVDIQANAVALLVQPTFWCMVASWIAATFVLALFRLRRTRVFAVVGTCAAGAVLLAGICASAWMSSGQVTWVPTTLTLVITLIPTALLLAFCALVPKRSYEDEDADEETYADLQ